MSSYDYESMSSLWALLQNPHQYIPDKLYNRCPGALAHVWVETLDVIYRDKDMMWLEAVKDIAEFRREHRAEATRRNKCPWTGWSHHTHRRTCNTCLEEERNYMVMFVMLNVGRTVEEPSASYLELLHYWYNHLESMGVVPPELGQMIERFELSGSDTKQKAVDHTNASINNPS